MTYPVSDALEKATGKSGQELTNLLASHLMHIGRAGNHGHQLPPLLGINRSAPGQKSHARVCTQCKEAADLVKLIEQTLLEPVAVSQETNK
jgi:hypothetical protein